jgi:hypothetical protein
VDFFFNVALRKCIIALQEEIENILPVRRRPKFEISQQGPGRHVINHDQAFNTGMATLTEV